MILSGTGTDGTLGIKEIKAHDGLVLVQTEVSAAYDGMPRSAISTGLVDRVLAPEEMPEIIRNYFTLHSKGIRQKKVTAPASVDSEPLDWLNKIFAILRTQVGHDFSAYKANTLLRRITRRMNLNQIESHEKYVQFIRENPNEVEALFRELLIGVTHFFRDPESFDVLKSRVLPDILLSMNHESTLRAWIPGCSTGEEVYSLAIIIREALDNHAKRINVQLFGTDIDDRSIDKARQGIFPASIAADVSAERLDRFFIQEGDYFRVRKEIRDCAVFSIQDLVRDPPFSRLQLLCCRNLLIYLEAEAQKKLLPLFHFTLAPNGFLVLGSSETVGGFSNLFKTVDKKWKIFRHKPVPVTLRQQVVFPSGPSITEKENHAELLNPAGPKKDFAQIAQKAILDQFSPTALLIDPKGNILHVQGRTGRYLETPSGPPTQNILDMAREGLRIELSSAIRAARSSNLPVVRKKISVRTNGDIQWINLHVCPQETLDEVAAQLLVVFEDIKVPAQSQDFEKSAPQASQHEPSRIAELERELQNTRESHQTTIEELESSNEELKSTNEEMQSSNEELQSTNEELESSKEELQSLNEELQTVNAELNSKVEELSTTHNDMLNLLNSTEIATIFVDNDLRVRRFTPKATTIINLIQTDVGRPLQHVVNNLSYERMVADLKEVLEKLIPKSIEVQTHEGQWFDMRILPYRTTDNRNDGVVLTFTPISEQKNAQQVLKYSNIELEEALYLARAVFDINSDPLAVFDQAGNLIIANKTFYKAINMHEEKARDPQLLNIFTDLLQQTKTKALIMESMKKEKEFNEVPPIPSQDYTIIKEELEDGTVRYRHPIGSPVETSAMEMDLLIGCMDERYHSLIALLDSDDYKAFGILFEALVAYNTRQLHEMIEFLSRCIGRVEFHYVEIGEIIYRSGRIVGMTVETPESMEM
ncbi:MAG: CheR family methyltransferase, partial [Planctomycetota bacterium]